MQTIFNRIQVFWDPFAEEHMAIEALLSSWDNNCVVFCVFAKGFA